MRILSVLRRLARTTSSFAIALALLSGSLAHAGGPSDQAVQAAPTRAETTDRFIIRLRDPAANAAVRLPAITSRAGTAFTYVRAMSGGAHVVRLTQGSLSAGQTVAQRNRLVAQQLMLDPEILYAEPDRKVYPMLVPNDPLYPQQWNYFEPAGGIDLPAAWDITTGSTAIVVAVIDTGILPHQDLVGRTVPGYDFIGDLAVSNDGNGRDADPTDPGDYGCNGNSSSWHGTHVSGTIGASSNNGLGVTGVNWVSKILPARVLGVCGGYLSDVADGMRWSAGIAVTGVPINANPAQVENLSLGDTNPCSNTFQSAINDVVARGTVVVVAAGNANADVSTSEPGNCTGVIAVGATLRNGGRASFSNYGTGVTISAPGGVILSTLNSGTTVAGADSYSFYSGTSMAAPHVAGVVSLMLSQNPALTPAQVKTRLQQTARAFPTGTGSDCTTALCGAGIVDAAAALAPVTVTRTNLAASANGAVASATSSFGPGFEAANVNNGDHIGRNWGAGGSWADATRSVFPDTVRVDFPTATTVSEIDVYTLQDNFRNPVEPTASMTFSQYGITAFDVQYLSGSTWTTVPGGHITGNANVWNKFTFTPVVATAIRAVVNGSVDGYTEVVEIEAYNDAPRVNVASQVNGASASASSSLGAGYAPSEAIDGDRLGLNWGTSGGWADGTRYAFPDQLQINFNQTRSINEIDVYTLQDNYLNPQEPAATDTFTKYGLTAFDVQYWNGTTWVTIPNGTVDANNKVWRKFTFAAIFTTAIRINVRGGADGWSCITEVEAYLAQ